MDSQAAPRIETLEAFNVIGMEVECLNHDISKIPALWEAFFARIKELEGFKAIWGVCLQLKSGAAGFRYLACALMDESVEAPDGMVKELVPTKKYAVYPFHGKPEEMSKLFSEIYGSLLFKGGLKPDPSYQCLEVYPDDCWDEATGTLKADLYVSVL